MLGLTDQSSRSGCRYQGWFWLGKCWTSGDIRMVTPPCGIGFRRSFMDEGCRWKQALEDSASRAWTNLAASRAACWSKGVFQHISSCQVYCGTIILHWLTVSIKLPSPSSCSRNGLLILFPCSYSKISAFEGPSNLKAEILCLRLVFRCHVVKEWKLMWCMEKLGSHCIGISFYFECLVNFMWILR